MGLFGSKKKAVKEIRDGAWGFMVNKMGVDVDTLSRSLRCVEREGTVEGKGAVTFLRIFKPADADAKGVQVVGWETFDQHPELVLYEGYLTRSNQAFIERKQA